MPSDTFNLPEDPEYAPGHQHPRLTPLGYARLRQVGVLESEIPALQLEDERIASGNWELGRVPADYQTDFDALLGAGCTSEEAEAILGTTSDPLPPSLAQHQADEDAVYTLEAQRESKRKWTRRNPAKNAEYQRRWRENQRAKATGAATPDFRVPEE